MGELGSVGGGATKSLRHKGGEGPFTYTSAEKYSTLGMVELAEGREDGHAQWRRKKPPRHVPDVEMRAGEIGTAPYARSPKLEGGGKSIQKRGAVVIWFRKRGPGGREESRRKGMARVSDRKEKRKGTTRNEVSRLFGALKLQSVRPSLLSLDWGEGATEKGDHRRSGHKRGYYLK